MDTTPFQWFQIAQTLVMAAAAVFVWLWGRDRAASVSQAVFDQRLGALDRRVDAMGQDVAGICDRVDAVALANAGLVDRLRAIFLPMDRADDLLRESREDRAALRREIDRLRDERRSDG